MKIVSVVGARPQFVKLAPIAHACARRPDIDHVIVHTGQHYDRNMSDVFFELLNIPHANVDLGIGSGSHGQQTGAMLAAIETVLEREKPDWTLVYGDTNSTIAATLAAVKIHLPVAHLEAGLRSFNRRMPEEHNRVLTDHAADLLLAPTEVAMSHLADEGLTSRSVLVGDVMADVCLGTAAAVAHTPAALPAGVDPAEQYILATIHRADNTDDRDRLATILDHLAALPVPVVLAAHPRLVARAATFGLTLDRGSIRTVEPLTYPEMVAAVRDSAGVITDSGGLQKEAYLLGAPCTTIRTETEWVETLAGGWNVLDPELTDLPRVALRPRPAVARSHPYGRGDAAERAISTLIDRAE
ncbi:MAG: UDP-N-acetylglucosamine 2-epimerase (non-hydrolyzing) [Nakamurella sp.]